MVAGKVEIVKGTFELVLGQWKASRGQGSGRQLHDIKSGGIGRGLASDTHNETLDTIHCTVCTC